MIKAKGDFEEKMNLSRHIIEELGWLVQVIPNAETSTHQPVEPQTGKTQLREFGQTLIGGVI